MTLLSQAPDLRSRTSGDYTDLVNCTDLVLVMTLRSPGRLSGFSDLGPRWVTTVSTVVCIFFLFTEK